MINENEIKEFIKKNESAMYKLLRELCEIPAPSNHEELRAEYCKRYFDSIGATDAYIDDALNVVFPINCEGSDNITVFVAHTDTVFPDMEPMPYTESDGKIYCPGVGDDTASLAVLLITAKYFTENEIKPKDGIIFVANSGEEGLGNLKGTKEIFKTYAGRIGRFVSFDSHLDNIYDECVGSHRYEVTVKTEGGHSFSAFGNNNAIHRISEMITKIYSIEVPKREGSVTTYNVGIISGGTSVNTIAENASMLCEYRSNNAECLAVMKGYFNEIFESAETDKISVDVKCVGERPCAENLDTGKEQELVSACADIVRSVIGKEPKFRSASTDCNIPMSLGIPSVCVGVYTGGGTHTRGEWIERASMIPGLEIGIKAALEVIK